MKSRESINYESSFQVETDVYVQEVQDHTWN